MKLRSTLMTALQNHIKRSTLSQTHAANLFGVNELRISNLVHGKIDLYALDTLANMTAAAGMRVEMRSPKAA